MAGWLTYLMSIYSDELNISSNCSAYCSMLIFQSIRTDVLSFMLPLAYNVLRQWTFWGHFWHFVEAGVSDNHPWGCWVFDNHRWGCWVFDNHCWGCWCWLMAGFCSRQVCNCWLHHDVMVAFLVLILTMVDGLIVWPPGSLSSELCLLEGCSRELWLASLAVRFVLSTEPWCNLSPDEIMLYRNKVYGHGIKILTWGQYL